MYFYLANVEFGPTPTLTAAPSNTETTVMATMVHNNALVICNHGPPTPRGRTGDSRGNERCFYFCIVPAVWGKYQGFVLYRQKRGCNENITDCGGKLPWFYQLTVPAVWGL